MTPDDLRDRVNRYYASDAASDGPLLLSTFGKILRREKLWPIDGETRSLASVIADLAPDLVLTRDPDAEAFVVITPKGKEEIAVQAIERRQDLNLLKRLPRAVLLAFCAQTPDAVYLRCRPPYRYSIDERPPDEGYIRVDPEFRMPGVFLDESRNLSPPNTQRLMHGVRRWAARHNIDLKSMASERPSAVAQVAAEQKQAANALERLYQAQPPEWRDRLVVPVDIALTLSRLN
jgi:hypothetical protein